MSEFKPRQLLCTFSTDLDFNNVAENIKSFYNIFGNKIFVFSNIKNPKEVFLTYNVLNMNRSSQKFPNTILIHRKKQTNTLYSLNALNTLIKEENGCMDKSFELEWDLYRNSLVISSDISVRIVSLKMVVILE